MDKGRYRRGFHTVTDFKYHFVRKTKYGHHVLKGDIALRLREIITEVCARNKKDIISGNIRSDHIHIPVRSTSYLSPTIRMMLLNLLRFGTKQRKKTNRIDFSRIYPISSDGFQP